MHSGFGEDMLMTLFHSGEWACGPVPITTSYAPPSSTPWRWKGKGICPIWTYSWPAEPGEELCRKKSYIHTGTCHTKWLVLLYNGKLSTEKIIAFGGEDFTVLISPIMWVCPLHICNTPHIYSCMHEVGRWGEASTQYRLSFLVTTCTRMYGMLALDRFCTASRNVVTSVCCCHGPETCYCWIGASCNIVSVFLVSREERPAGWLVQGVTPLTYLLWFRYAL